MFWRPASFCRSAGFPPGDLHSSFCLCAGGHVSSTPCSGDSPRLTSASMLARLTATPRCHHWRWPSPPSSKEAHAWANPTGLWPEGFLWEAGSLERSARVQAQREQGAAHVLAPPKPESAQRRPWAQVCLHVAACEWVQQLVGQTSCKPLKRRTFLRKYRRLRLLLWERPLKPLSGLRKLQRVSRHPRSGQPKCSKQLWD